jgi:integral membrane sensor domain MASE1
VFGALHVRWLRRQAAKGEKVPEPVFQFVFGVILAPIALAIVVALAWTLLHAL